MMGMQMKYSLGRHFWGISLKKPTYPGDAWGTFANFAKKEGG